jgi:nucleoside-diphosphate-sugar epimerase
MEKLPTSLARAMGDLGTCVGGVDVRDADALNALFREHADENTTVWNLAAPLSVETAMDPSVAEAVTVGGMENVLDAMKAVGARRICFTDSIGSFGAEAPRVGATARWLNENPTQDPGSDYGRQKRGCRELMTTFAKEHGGDPRFAVLPGVLHSEPVWGNGTTEYALDALLAAPHQQTELGLPIADAYVCPIDPTVKLPMVFADDLMRGLIALQEADEAQLREPLRGYCIPGLSFTAHELFAEIRKHYPGFGFRVELDVNMNTFANLWPDELSAEEPLRDLGYAPSVSLPDVVAKVIASHHHRNVLTAQAFKDIAADGRGSLGRADIEGECSFIYRYIVRESCSQYDSLPLTSSRISKDTCGSSSCGAGRTTGTRGRRACTSLLTSSWRSSIRMATGACRGSHSPSGTDATRSRRSCGSRCTPRRRRFVKKRILRRRRYRSASMRSRPRSAAWARHQ